MIEKEIIVAVIATLAANYIVSSLKKDDDSFKSKKEIGI